MDKDIIDKIYSDFKIHHKNIILSKDIIWYNDAYLAILISKNITIKLNEKTDHNINYKKNTECMDTQLCKLSFYDFEKIKIIDNYTETLMYRQKFLTSLSKSIRKLSIYNYDNSLINTFLYFKKKFNLPKDLNIIFVTNTTSRFNLPIINNLKNNFVNYKYHYILNDDYINIIENNSCFINDFNVVSYNNYDERLKFIVNIYNTLIKLDLNDNIYIIKLFIIIKTEIIIQIIELLNLYFETVHLVSLKYDLGNITFFLLVHKKIKKYDSKHHLDIIKVLSSSSILDIEIKSIYKEFLNSMFSRFNNMCRLLLTLKNIKESNKNDYKQIKRQITIYKDYYNLKTKLIS